MEFITALFADINDLFHGGMRKYHKRLDYEKFYKYIEEQYGKLFRAFAYGIATDTEAKFFQQALKHIGFECRWQTKEQFEVCPICETKIECFVNPDWSVTMAMEIVRLIDKVDQIIIASNDLRLIPCIQWIKERGVQCVICAFKVEEALKQEADKWFEIPKALLIKKAKNGNSEVP